MLNATKSQVKTGGRMLCATL